jgi:hypothetical protein
MQSSGMLHHVAVVRTDVSEERIASIIRVTRISANAVPSSLILVTLMMEAIHSSEMSVITRVTWRNIPEDGILHNLTCCYTGDKYT